MDAKIYHIKNPDMLVSPALLYYEDLIVENTNKAIAIAGDPDRLWPHVKTHKIKEITRLLIDKGVTRFKCATIAEAEMVASCQPTDIILAYPLIGPNIVRFLKLMKAFPATKFWAIGDNLEQVKQLGKEAGAAGTKIHFLTDVNVGQNRTGVGLNQLISFYEDVSKVENIEADGLHCFDGHIHENDFHLRCEAVEKIAEQVLTLRNEIISRGYACSQLVMGGTPTFPCYAKYPEFYMSPGTVFLFDYNYYSNYRDMDFVPAGIILTRVISHPTKDTFTLDLGCKGISCDSAGIRGVIVGMEDITTPLAQSEEHWVFSIAPGHENERPPIGSVLYVMPAHICPSTVLYPSAHVVHKGEVNGYWNIAARDRILTY